MKHIKILILLSLSVNIFSQNLDLSTGSCKLKERSVIEKDSPRLSVTSSENFIQGSLFDSVTTKKESVKRSTKSPGLALIYGLLVPGMGHVYADRFNTGKYFMISEAAIWLTYAAFTIYGNWLLDDAYSFSNTHAGVDLSGKDKDDAFFVNISNYSNVEQYNDEMLRFGEYDKVYLPGSGYDFRWDSETNRKLYREDKLAGDRTLNDRLFVIGAVLINHLVSGFSALFAANSYNDEVRKGSGGIMMRASVQKHFNRIDGISLNLTKMF